MSSSTGFRYVRILLFALLAGLLIGGGIALYRMFLEPNPENLLAKAEAAYNTGVQQLEAKNGAGSAQSFDEAQIQADKALDALDKARVQKKNQTPEAQARLSTLAGNAFWIRARALRDHSFALALKEGPEHAIEETLDSSTGERFRNFLAIPDPKKRTEAINSLYRSAELSSEDKEIQGEALRLTMMLQPLNWKRVTELSERLLAIEEGDDRALFMLARYEFEQPRADGQPVTEAKKNRRRMLEARDYLNKISKDYRLWRTLDLKVKVTRWLLADAKRDRDPKRVTEETKKLDTLLFDPQNGALERAAKFEDLKGKQLSSWDFEGVLRVHVAALQSLFQRIREGENVKVQAMDAMAKTLSFCREMVKSESSPHRVEQATLTTIEGLEKVQPLIDDRTDPQWNGWLEAVQDLAREAREKNVVAPQMYIDLAQLLARESHLRETDAKARTRLYDEAQQWVNTGIEVGEQAKVNTSDLVPLYSQAAEAKLLQADAEEAQKLLATLKNTNTPEAQTSYHLLAGVIAERQGRLEDARQHLERVAVEGTEAGIKLRAHFVLPSIYLALGKPTSALFSLGQADKAYARIELMPKLDQKWLEEFLQSRDQIRLLLVTANLGSAREKAAEYLRRNPGKQVPYSVLQTEEKKAIAHADLISPKSPQYLPARQALLAFQATTGRLEEAQQQLAELRKSNPDKFGLFHLEIALKLRGKKSDNQQQYDPKLVSEVDQLYQEFLDIDPKNTPAKLHYVQWLVDSGRADAALAYLDDSSKFPPPTAAAYQRIRTVVLAKLNKREELLQSIQDLANDDPLSDLLYLKYAGSVEEQEKRLGEALTRHERNGIFLWMQGGMLLQKKEYEKAIDAFVRAKAFTHIKQSAEVSLRRALATWARTEPKKVQEKTELLAKEFPEDPIPLLGYAYACLQLDLIGQPRDHWPIKKTMAAALNKWEELHLRAGNDPIQGPLVKAEAWILVNEFDRATTEVLRARNINDKNTFAIRLLIGIALARSTSDSLGQAEKYLAELTELDPNAFSTMLIKGQLQTKQGHDSEAIKTYEALVTLFPKNISGYRELVKLLMKLDQSPQARDWINRWRIEQPDAILPAKAEISHLIKTGNKREAKQVSERFVKEQLAKLKTTLVERKKPATIEQDAWEKRIVQAQEDGQLRLLLEMAVAFAAGGDLDEVETLVARAKAIRPESLGGDILLADCAIKREQWDEACKIYEEVLEKSPHHYVANNNLADLLARHLGEPRKAYTIAQKLRISPLSGKSLPGNRLPTAFLDTLGMIYQNLDEAAKYPEMRGTYEEALRRYPTDPHLHFYLALASVKLGQKSEARQHLDLALQYSTPDAPCDLDAQEREQIRKTVADLEAELSAKETP